MIVRRRGQEPIDPRTCAGIVISAHPVAVIRFEWAERSLSFVLSELRQWELVILEAEDRLQILAGANTVTLSGKNLVPIRNALDLQRLQLVRESPSPHGRHFSDPWIRSIQLQAPKSPPRQQHPHSREFQ